MNGATTEAEDHSVYLPSAHPTDQIDPIEGTSSENNDSPIDESSNDSTTSSLSVLKPTDPVKCDTCSVLATLSFFKQRQPASGGKTEDIFKSYCSNCKTFFGMSSKKVRGVFSFVNEDGRILSNSERLEFLRSQKRARSASRSNSVCQVPEKGSGVSNSDTSTNGNSDEKDEEIAKEDDEGIDEDDGDEETPEQKTTIPKKKPKNAFGGKSKKNNWGTRKKSKAKVSQVQSTSSEKISKKDQENARPRETKLRNTPTVTPIDKKRGRPIKISPRAATISSVSTKPTHTSEFFKSSPITSHVSKTAETCCQTDTDLLLKSTYLKECFNTTVRDALGEPVAARLNDMPMVLKKKFLLMIRTISEQEKRILKYEENEEKSLLAVKTLKDFGRSTRLEFSDSFRNIRADLVERKEEFKAHEAEVVAVIKSQTRTYEAYKQQMQKNAEDQKLEYSALLAKVEFLQQELTYEKDRAEFYLRARDVCKKEQNKAIEQAETAVKNLNDRLFLADNETCTRCKTVEKIRKKMTMEVAEMTEKCARANQERNDAVERAALFESAAQKLGKDCDSIKYERDSWKAYAERYKKDVIKLTHTLKEKDKELLDKIAEIAATPKSITTPRSVACTPNDPERVSPPEDGEIVDTPPHSSPQATLNPAPKAVAKPLIQQIVEKKAPPQIASGFESWIPKEKLNAPAPSIPKSVSAFGVPLKPPNAESERPKVAPSSQPNPWEKLAKSTSAAASNSLSEALSKVQADNFSGGGSTPSYSKSYLEEMNRVMSTRKRVVEEAAEVQKKPNPAPSGVTATPPKKAKTSNSVPPNKMVSAASTPSSSSTPGPASTSVGRFTNLKKIPKLSEKPPQAEFAPALGLSQKSDESGEIPGLGMEKLDDSVKEKEKEEMMKKIKPAESTTPTVKASPAQNPNKPNTPAQKQNKFNGSPNKKPNMRPVNRPGNSQAPPWQRSRQPSPPPSNQSPWRQQPQQQYGIQSNQNRGFQMDLGMDRPWSDSPSGPSGSRSNNSFSDLPWHRAQDTPFGKVPIQDNFAMSGPRPMPPRPMPPQQSPFFNNAPGNGFYPPQPRDFSPPQPPQQSRMFPPSQPPFGYAGPPNQGRGNPRSFYG